MTIVEASAFGCPSLVNVEGIGATQLLSDGMVVKVEMDDREKVVAMVRRLLIGDGRAMLREVAQRAKSKALSWDETAFASKTMAYLDDIYERSLKG